MNLGAPSSSDCSVVTRLVQFCSENGADLECMELVEREIGFLVAMSRQIIEARKRETERELTPEQIENAARKHGLLDEEGN